MSNPVAEGAKYYTYLRVGRHRLGRSTEDDQDTGNNVRNIRTRFRRALHALSHHGEVDSDNSSGGGDDDDDDDNDSKNYHRMPLWRHKPDEHDFAMEEQSNCFPSPSEIQATIGQANQDRTERVSVLSDEEEQQQQQQNFFVHPFNDTSSTALDKSPPSIGINTTANSESEPLLGTSENGKDANSEYGGTTSSAARDNWGKTVDKVKVVANIQNLPSRDSFLNTTVTIGPALDPLYAVLPTDESGRELPPIKLSLISVAVTDSEYLEKFGQWTFRIELMYGDIKWVIKRTIADFMSLHYKLKLKSTISDYGPSPPSFPDEMDNLISSAKTTIGMDRPEDEQDNPKDDEEEGSNQPSKCEAALARRKTLTTYLRDLLAIAHASVSYDICEFFEISAGSMSKDMGWKGKEGYLENRVRISSPGVCHCWISDRWEEEWVLLRDSYIAFFSSIGSSTPSDVLLFDKTFTAQMKGPSIFRKFHLSMGTSYREIEIKGDQRQIDEWMASIDKVAQNSPWVKPHRYDSFAPIRYNARVKWFVDGENHFNAVAEAILSAKDEIYITDWWLTPELFLRRPPAKNEEFRLDKLLQRKAEEGVKVYIIVYKEIPVALNIDSAHTKYTLQDLHENIIVQRHPDRRMFDNNADIYLWSHHDKIVVVDNRLAFLGGLDICFGRYDTHAHQLADYLDKGPQYQTFPGQDYSSPRVKDFLNVAQHDMSLVDRETTPRMPWHDMSCAVVGPIARDVARLFIERWNFLKSTKSMHRKNLPYLMPKGEYVAQRDESKFKGTCKVQLLRSVSSWSSGIIRERSIYDGYLDLISNARHYIYIENQFFISATGEDKFVRNRIGEAILNRIKRAYYQDEKFKVFILIPLIPAFQGDLASGDSMAARGVMHFQYMSISRGGASICEKLRAEGIEPAEYIGWYSLRNWDKIIPRFPKKREFANGNHGDLATLVPPQQESDLATLTSVNSDNSSGAVEDDREHYVSELVYIHDKLMIVDDRAVILGSANINDRSMLGNRDSEVGIIIEDKEMVSSFMDGKPYQAAKFAHTLRMQLWKEHLGLLDFKDWSALMDPNDDSILQNRATEGAGYKNRASGYSSDLASLGLNNESEIRDCEANEAVQVLDRMSRTKSTYEKFSHGPRGHHLKEAAALDPLSDRFYHRIWQRTAETNTLIYRDLFRCVPDDTVHNFDQHKQFIPAANVPYGHVADLDLSSRAIQEKLSSIRGHLVQFPIDYLKDEPLLRGVESMVPMILFT